jgi:hypothetical protein
MRGGDGGRHSLVISSKMRDDRDGGRHSLVFSSKMRDGRDGGRDGEDGGRNEV